MTADRFLPLLDRVRPTSKGWAASCPAHDDRHPSLTVKEGDKGLLVKCWTGCDLQAICAALHVRVTDLFYKTTSDPRTICAAQQARRHKQRARATAYRQELRAAALAHGAERLLDSARGLNIAAWTNDKLHDALETVADAHEVLNRERDATI
ncbi:hypothetical protein MYX04_05780 [Nitrospiraceae bacterium AH_259_D15_M11_P09]|nr:hypothetical protein [Nitrospiraceae bacterium AH_259_D15_M11_P09]